MITLLDNPCPGSGQQAVNVKVTEFGRPILGCSVCGGIFHINRSGSREGTVQRHKERSSPVNVLRQHVHDWNTPIQGEQWVCSCGETKPVERGSTGAIYIPSMQGEVGDHWIAMPTTALPILPDPTYTLASDAMVTYAP